MKPTLFAALLSAVGLLSLAGCTQENRSSKQAEQSKSSNSTAPSKSGQAIFLADKSKAEQGDAHAQFQLGNHYKEGYKVAQDRAEAVKWYRKAAEQNHVPAQIYLAYQYEQGLGVEKDLAEAYAWTSLAALPASNPFKNITALTAAKVAKDRDNLEKKMSAQQVTVGRKREAELRAKLEARTKGEARRTAAPTANKPGGTKAPQTADETKFWEHKAKAEQGDAQGQFDLGRCFSLGLGVRPDGAEALNWYRKAADQNHAAAQHMVGLRHVQGPAEKQNPAEAVKWWRKAAEQGHAVAQHRLGESYRFGRGVTADFGEAVLWYRKAADQNLAVAQAELGSCYSIGQGVQRNLAESAKWYRKAAEQMDPAAQNVLGLYYGKGFGVEKDLVESHAWFVLSGKPYGALAKDRENLERQMTAQQIAAGQKRAAELRAQLEAKRKSDGK